MLRLNGQNLLLGGFHDHWSRADGGNPSIFLAALNYYHYDFVTTMDGPSSDARMHEVAATFSQQMKMYPGREEALGWAHIVTVNPKGPPVPNNDPDIHGVLRRLRETCDLVILAHPNYIAWEPLVLSGELDRLLDEGLFDGIQIMTDKPHVPGTTDAQLLAWYLDRERRGKRTAVIGGWDLHLMKAIKGIPRVLYGSTFTPDGHYEAPCSSRSIVFADENTLPAITAAVKAGQTVVERLPTGELFGPKDLIDFLQAARYREAVADLDRRRDAIRLETSADRLMAGRPARLIVSGSGTVTLPVSFDETKAVPVHPGQPIEWPAIPVLLERDIVHLPIVWRGDNGQERIWAIESEHPIQLDVLPLFEGGRADIEILARKPFEGTVELRLEGLHKPITKTIAGSSKLELPIDLAMQISRYELRATNKAGLSRTFAGDLTFFPVSRFKGDWATIPKFGVDQLRFVPPRGYGSGREWPGPDTYSAQLQFAWTPAALLFRATVRDAIHYQPFAGHYAYNADCLQLGIDPMLRRKDTLGNVYCFNFAKTPAGPEIYRTWGPGDEATATFSPPRDETSLGDRYITITPVKGGLLYDAAIPWPELAPAQPEPGKRLGVYYIMFNNDGSGHLDTMHWPVPISGMWLKPNRWGVLTLVS